MKVSKLRKRTASATMLDPAILLPAIGQAFVKLDPRTLIKNPVMFVLEVVTALATVLTIRDAVMGGGNMLFELQIAVWLWFTILFANFAEAVAEGRGKAQADTLRQTRAQTTAKRLLMPGNTELYEGVAAERLQVGDLVLCEAGDTIPGDGEVIEGIASVNEAAVTGESAPVIRESGGDRSAVTGGTTVISDRVVVKITSAVGSSFLDRMIKLVEGAERQKTPNEIALNILLVGLTVIFVVVVDTIPSFASYAGGTISVIVLVALFVTLIPTTIGALLSAIGIAGMDRLVRFNVLAMSGRAVEAAGDIDTLLLDKTGTITFGNRLASEIIPVPGVSEQEAAEAALLASQADETAEGRSIVALAREKFGLSADAASPDARFIPFSATTRLSGVDLGDRRLRKGAVDSVLKFVRDQTGSDVVEPPAFRAAVDRIARAGGTPLGLAEGGRLLGVIHLKDVVKPDVKERFAALRRMGIKTVMITGDNPVTAASIASEAGVDDFIAQATPEDKLRYIRGEQAQGRLIAMCGDGTNDAPALAQADVGVAMQSGTQAAREAGNMVDLDSDPTKLIEVVEIGKQLLMTRGALTTFSIANDVAKYFAIIPAIFVAFYPQLGALNIMGLATPQSAILSAIVFNALIIIALIPLALKGVTYRPVGAAALLRRNLLIYGLGGLVLPFIGIKVIDLAVTALHLA
ncbi:K+-transporting ATPase ATPase B chain [Rhodopseudomonas thermotolerans]|uniref:Potassium-transporting ATPase ATP-binding subunit n=2 Tax=Rhodopseudomonas TaxID=1073 RepID=A0A336JW72_9BRAD|nr:MULTISPECIES: potassium-transporting ATPase subunit KdpB [Rhodopseudomonas]RED21391.1 K+-transporting ATPase ATPase B chain [Rhodopseudomonas pentothenatexigens]REF86885.1 K+-transporting ATPase ATPase B chain [Rhodopseudomonas thermotolerans]SSW93702.1 K+-transporting ATPase ATPase B chain [Rhodopseudomonas pentothenatexigens]